MRQEIVRFYSFLNAQSSRLVCLVVTLIVFLSLPGENFYQTLQILTKRPLVRQVFLPFPSPAPYPVKKDNVPPPEISASSALVLDDESKAILFAKNAKIKTPPASLTKIMTALVALERYDLDGVLVVRRLFSEGSQMGLFEGEKISVKNLLYGLLLASGNDAGFTLAENISGGIEQFVCDMNKKVAQFGLKDTHFTNPVGKDEQNHYSTAWDLAHLASLAMKNPVFAEIVNTSHIVVSNRERTKWHELENINILLGENLGVRGIKTGWTEKAGGCLIAFAQRGSSKIIVVILGSRDKYTRFDDARALINWTFASYQWRKLGRE